MGIPIMPTGYRHAYTLGYRWVFMGIDGYFDDLKKAAGYWLLACKSFLGLPASNFRLSAGHRCRIVNFRELCMAARRNLEQQSTVSGNRDER